MKVFWLSFATPAELVKNFRLEKSRRYSKRVMKLLSSFTSCVSVMSLTVCATPVRRPSLSLKTSKRGAKAKRLLKAYLK